MQSNTIVKILKCAREMKVFIFTSEEIWNFAMKPIMKRIYNMEYASKLSFRLCRKLKRYFNTSINHGTMQVLLQVWFIDSFGVALINHAKSVDMFHVKQTIRPTFKRKFVLGFFIKRFCLKFKNVSRETKSGRCFLPLIDYLILIIWSDRHL